MHKKLFTTATIAMSLTCIQTANAATTPNAEKALNMALDDEYKAYSNYKVIIEKYGEIKPFSNIIYAEQRHINALIATMQRYNIPTPNNKYLLPKYAPQAPNSIKAACEAGINAEIENANLYDNKLIPMVKGYSDIEITFKNLRDASQYRHLEAFKRCAARY